MEPLSDKPCSGALPKLDAAAVGRLVQWLREQLLTATELLQRHIEAQGSPVNVNTLERVMDFRLCCMEGCLPLCRRDEQKAVSE